jgi:hypothetical protein
MSPNLYIFPPTIIGAPDWFRKGYVDCVDVVLQQHHTKSIYVWPYPATMSLAFCVEWETYLHPR